jgi:hypothetical protein
MKTRSITASLLSLTMLMLCGCPGMPVADPYTESRISNKTAQPIEVELTLDPQKYGLKAADDPTPFAQEWFKPFEDGQGVEALGIDAAALTGRYRIAPSGFMITYSGMGTKPWISFRKLAVTQGDKTLALVGEKDIAARFQPTGEPGRYEFPVTSDLFAAHE